MEKLLNKNESLQINPWHPDRPVSKGATAYHNAVVNASYYLQNLNELLAIVKNKIKDNEVIVDFGAGTGASAMHLLDNLKIKFKLWLVDNSAAWLGKAYEILHDKLNVECFLLEKLKDRYATLAETVGAGAVDHVISANTFHLIPDLEETFRGINFALKPEGTFTFQSGNIVRDDREQGLLMIDDTFNRIHDISLDIVKKEKKFRKYKANLDTRILMQKKQRKFVFPEPRHINEYLGKLKAAGFSYHKPIFKSIKIKYSDWLKLLGVKRVQAGILPEIGGKEPTREEEHDRDELIGMSSGILFEELESQNPFADSSSFTAEWVYITAYKSVSMMAWG